MTLLRRLLPSGIFALCAACLSTPASAQGFAAPVPMNSPPGLYPPPHTDSALVTIADDGRFVDACGRVGNILAKDHGVFVGDRILVLLPPQADLDSYFGKVACVQGTVRVRDMDGFRRITVAVDSPQQFTIIGGQGPWTPPRPQCGPGEMAQNGGCVRRYRASPY